MSAREDLVRRLAAVDPSRWEDEYARSAIELTREDELAIVGSKHAFADWFAFRFDAGPPGVPLPSWEQAVEAVVEGTGSALDAYRVVRAGRPWPADRVAVLTLLNNSAACALSKGSTWWFAGWLVARAGLAALALGEPQRAWTLLDLTTIEGQRHPQLQELALFEPIRGTALERDPWVQLAIARLWPSLGVAVLPQLPLEKQDLPPAEKTLDALGALADQRLGAVVLAGILAVQRATEHEATQPVFDALLAAVRAVATRVGERQSSPDEVEDAALRIEVPALSIALLELAEEQAELSPMEALLLALAMRRAVAGTEHAKLWAPAFAARASWAIHELRSVPLFALRLRLLDELIGAPGPGMSLAHLHYQRANTRAAPAVGAGEDVERAHADLIRSAELAVAEGDAGLRAMAVAARANLLSRTSRESERAEDWARARGEIEAALAAELTPWEQALLHRARGHLLRRKDPAAALPAFEQALALLPEGEPLWVDVAAEVVATALMAGRVEAALERGRAFLVQASSQSTGTELAMLHAAVGDALLRAECFGEACTHLESALAQLRARDPYNETLVRLQLVRLGIEARDWTLADEHLRTLRDRRPSLHDDELLDLLRSEAAAAHARGQVHEERAALEEALEVARGIDQRIPIELQRAQIDPAQDAGALLERALALPPDPDRDAAIEQLACSGEAHLQPQARARFEAWAEARGRSAAVAKSLDLGGDTIRALAVLREALGRELALRDRLACTHLLVTMLGAEDREERRAACAELERLLELEDVPHSRIDLAIGLHRDADDDHHALWSAWGHGLRALQDLHDAKSRTFAHAALQKILEDLLRSTLPVSAVTGVELARPLVELVRRDFGGKKAAAMVRRLEALDGRIAEVKAERSARDAQSAPAAPPTTAAEKARALFHRGVELLQHLREHPHEADAARMIAEARAQLEDAVRIGEEEDLPERFAFLVSLGNALKMPPGEDLERALEIYARAAKLEARADQKATLHKVHADALLDRGRPEDVRRARELLDQSLRVRSGRLRTEALFSAATAALADPDLDEVARHARAVERLLDAARADPQHAEQILELLTAHLAKWRRLRPDDPRLARAQAEVLAIYPQRAKEIEHPTAGPTSAETDAVVRFLRHPSGRAYMEVSMRLISKAERSADVFGRRRGLDPAVLARIDEDAERTSLLGRPEEMEHALAALDESADPEARPGIAVARVSLLAHLARLDRRPPAEVRAATELARAALEGLADPIVRARLLHQLATVWSPHNHADDPVRDFDLAAELLRRCVELEGGEASALEDTLEFLARALRYAQAGDLHANLRESRRIYTAVLERARTSSGPDVVAGLLNSLAEVEAQLGEGDHLDRLRRCERLMVEAIELTRSPYDKARNLMNLAFDRSQIAYLLEGEERRAMYERSLATFDEADVSMLEPDLRQTFAHNRTVAAAALARLTKGRRAEIEIWRARVAVLEEDGKARYLLAITQHNLANALLFGAEHEEDLEEGLRLSRQAIAVRTIPVNARHHWETAINAAWALLPVLARQGLRGDQERWREARDWARRAIAAARVLGRGEELADAGFALADVASFAATTTNAVELAEDAWAVVREAVPSMLANAKRREQEAQVALRIAFVLIDRLAAAALRVSSPGITFVLGGDAAELGTRWLLRAQRPLRRPLQARLDRQAEVSEALWAEWLDVLNKRDVHAIADVLGRIHQVAPAFLAAEKAEMEETWRWLEAHPRSAAVMVTPARSGAMALLARIEDGRRRSWILGLDVPPPPFDAKTTAASLREAVHRDERSEAHEAVAAWGQRFIAAPLLRFMREPPSAVLWIPGPELRPIVPSAIWGRLPVASAASIALPDLRVSRRRSRSTVLALADGDGRLHRAGGDELFRSLSSAASARGPVRLLASDQASFGRALLGGDPRVRDTPASAEDLLAEAAEHEVIAVVAHGDRRSLACVDASGRPSVLDVAALSRAPEALIGATVLLLACDSGRVGESLAEPDGVAGALLCAGARCVVAPLLPVRLDVAAELGASVLRGLARDEAPWDVLARLPAIESDGARALQRRAFVAWVG